MTDLAEKGADGGFLREAIQSVAQRLMEMGVASLCAAAWGPRSPHRTNSLDGYRERSQGIRAGTVELQIPKLRKCSYFPAFLQPRRTAGKALAAVVQEAYVPGGVDPLGRPAGAHLPEPPAGSGTGRICGSMRRT